MKSDWEVAFEQLPAELQAEIMRNESPLVHAIKARSDAGTRGKLK